MSKATIPRSYDSTALEKLLQAVGDLCNALGDPKLTFEEVRRDIGELQDMLHAVDVSGKRLNPADLNMPAICERILNPATIDPATLQLEPSDDQPGYLLGVLKIGELMMHVEAIRATLTEEGEWSTECPECESRLDDLITLAGDAGFTTTALPGHDGYWIIYCTPFC